MKLKNLKELTEENRTFKIEEFESEIFIQQSQKIHSTMKNII